ncbi:MAG: hypothetical protein VX519_10640 [Myxococcota bacterium]|nr:hypothetical protein [Myxococcota bacterium]
MLSLLFSLSMWVHLLGAVLYGGPLVCFAIALSIPARFSGVGRHQLIGMYQRFGSLMGLSMGALIFGGIGLHWAQWGLHWPGGGVSGQLGIKYGVFFVLWVSSFHLEIWTIDPIRLGAPEPAKHVVRFIRQLQVNSLLFLAVLALSLL